MYMRIVQARIDANQIAEIQRVYTERVVPRLESVPGCLCARLIQSASHKDELLSMTLWDTQEHAEAYEQSGLFKELIEEAKPFLMDSAEWKIQLTEDLTLQYEPVQEEPVVRALPVVAQSDSEICAPEEVSQMHVRIVSPRLKPGKLEEFTKLYRETIVPALRKVPGCRYAYLAESTDGSEVYSVTVWDNPEAASAYEANGLFDRLTEKVKHTLSELYQWKMALERDYGKRLTTSEDLRVDRYDVVTGKRFR